MKSAGGEDAGTRIGGHYVTALMQEGLDRWFRMSIAHLKPTQDVTGMTA